MGGTTDMNVSKAVARQMLSALCELHRCELVHTDVRLENFHVAAGGVVKLAELSQVRAASTASHEVQKQVEETSAMIGHRAFTPPEFVQVPPEDKLDLSKVDSYQAGVALFALLLGRYPILSQEHISKPMRDRADLSQYRECLSDECRNLLEQLLAPHPDNRPSACEALEHEWLHLPSVHPPVSQFAPSTGVDHGPVQRVHNVSLCD